MEKTLFEMAASNGIWAALYVFLFIYVLLDSRKREKTLQETIGKNQKIIGELSERLEVVIDIHRNVNDIKEEIRRHG